MLKHSFLYHHFPKFWPGVNFLRKRKQRNEKFVVLGSTFQFHDVGFETDQEFLVPFVSLLLLLVRFWASLLALPQAVLKMLNEIGSVENIPDFIEGVKNRWAAPVNILLFTVGLVFSLFSHSYLSVLFWSWRKRKMSGFGHRVYKNYDPRAKVIKQLAEEVFSIVGRDPLIEVFTSRSILRNMLMLTMWPKLMSW